MEASVVVDSEPVGQIGAGLLLLVCAMQDDTNTNASKLAAKVSKLRIFDDAAGKMNRSVLDTRGSALIVSQFTLAADTRSGNRPGFSTAADPQKGKALYEYFTEQLKSLGIPVAIGRFGANMQVRLINDGPVTIWLET